MSEVCLFNFGLIFEADTKNENLFVYIYWIKAFLWTVMEVCLKPKMVHKCQNVDAMWSKLDSLFTNVIQKSNLLSIMVSRFPVQVIQMVWVENI